MSTPQVNQLGLIGMLSHAGPMAIFVLLLLLAASVVCWGIIISKYRTLKQATEENVQFLNLFWHGQTIDDILGKSEKYLNSPIAAIFRSGVKELRKLTGEQLDLGGVEKIENVQRALARASNTEIAQLEKHVNWLATTASSAPFVGLFGTVWGIMASFQSIGMTGAANLAVVAPGISEALIATAAGIGAAIPAVIGYNHFVGQIKRVSVDMESFSQDFINIVQRSVLNSKTEKKGK